MGKFVGVFQNIITAYELRIYHAVKMILFWIYGPLQRGIKGK